MSLHEKIANEIANEAAHHRSTLDLDAFMKDSMRGLASIRSHNKDAQAKTREKKVTCSNPTCDREESPSGALRACSQCHAARYCSSECQKADWKAHKKSCLSFERLPICRDFDPTLIHPGCKFSTSPIFAKGHKDGVGYWVAPGGMINCQLAKSPGLEDLMGESRTNGEPASRFDPDFTRKIQEFMPGPRYFLGVRVLVQNRMKEPICVFGDEITAAINHTQIQEFYDGAWDEGECEIDIERVVDSQTVSGTPTPGQRPCHYKLAYFNGKRVDQKKKHDALRNEKRCIVFLKPTEHACFHLQYRLGSIDRTLDFEAWDLINNISVFFTTALAVMLSNNVQMRNICAPIDRNEIDRWYADYKAGGELAHIASHHGDKRAKMQRALRAAQADDPVLRYMDRTLRERFASSQPMAEQIAELRDSLDSSGLPPDVVERIKASVRPRARAGD
ncbi:unnamed protein product [Peniophora sp. CBMAI 1063]|nr:unnamed protein product [Peniophora sp. CBMAI 1063]